MRWMPRGSRDGFEIEDVAQKAAMFGRCGSRRPLGDLPGRGGAAEYASQKTKVGTRGSMVHDWGLSRCVGARLLKPSPPSDLAAKKGNGVEIALRARIVQEYPKKRIPVAAPHVAELGRELLFPAVVALRFAVWASPDSSSRRSNYLTTYVLCGTWYAETYEAPVYGADKTQLPG